MEYLGDREVMAEDIWPGWQEKKEKKNATKNRPTEMKRQKTQSAKRPTLKNGSVDNFEHANIR